MSNPQLQVDFSTLEAELQRGIKHYQAMLDEASPHTKNSVTIVGLKVELRMDMGDRTQIMEWDYAIDRNPGSVK